MSKSNDTHKWDIVIFYLVIILIAVTIVFPIYRKPEMYNVVVYDRALTEEEIDEIFKDGPSLRYEVGLSNSVSAGWSICRLDETHFVLADSLMQLYFMKIDSLGHMSEWEPENEKWKD